MERLSYYTMREHKSFYAKRMIKMQLRLKLRVNKMMVKSKNINVMIKYQRACKIYNQPLRVGGGQLP